MLKFFLRLVLVVLLIMGIFIIPITMKRHSSANFALGQVTGVSVYMNSTLSTLTWSEINNADGYEVSLTSNSGEKHFFDVSTNVLVLSSDLGNNFKVRAYKYVGEKKMFGEYSSPFQT